MHHSTEGVKENSVVYNFIGCMLSMSFCCICCPSVYISGWQPHTFIQTSVTMLVCWSQVDKDSVTLYHTSDPVLSEILTHSLILSFRVCRGSWRILWACAWQLDQVRGPSRAACSPTASFSPLPSQPPSSLCTLTSLWWTPHCASLILPTLRFVFCYPQRVMHHFF